MRSTFSFWMDKWYLKMPKIVQFVIFWILEMCGQTVIPEWSLLFGQKLLKNAKIQIWHFWSFYTNVYFLELFFWPFLVIFSKFQSCFDNQYMPNVMKNQKNILPFPLLFSIKDVFVLRLEEAPLLQVLRVFLTKHHGVFSIEAGSKWEGTEEWHSKSRIMSLRWSGNEK